MDLLYDILVLDDGHVSVSLRLQQGRGLESQIITEAAYRIHIAMFYKELLPYFGEHTADLAKQQFESWRIIDHQVGQIGEWDEVLDRFEYPVAHTSDCLHAIGKHVRQRIEDGENFSK